jgi:hypothetical protein
MLTRCGLSVRKGVMIFGLITTSSTRADYIEESPSNVNAAVELL